MTGETTRPPERFVVHATSDSHFAWFRTRLSVERTLMSWARTAIALIGFGFTIVKFFEQFGSMEGVTAAAHPEAPRYFGLVLIAAGVIAITISIIQYHMVIKYLWTQQFSAIAGLRERPGHTPTLAVALILLLIGILTFVSILFRVI